MISFMSTQPEIYDSMWQICIIQHYGLSMDVLIDDGYEVD